MLAPFKCPVNDAALHVDAVPDPYVITPLCFDVAFAPNGYPFAKGWNTKSLLKTADYYERQSQRDE